MNVFPSFSAHQEYLDCEIIALPARYDFKPYAYGFQKDSPYLGLFNYYLKKMIESGSMHQILTKYESRGQICPDMSGQAIGFPSCFTAFLALLFGFVCSLGLALLGMWNWHSFFYNCEYKIIPIFRDCEQKVKMATFLATILWTEKPNSYAGVWSSTIEAWKWKGSKRWYHLAIEDSSEISQAESSQIKYEKGNDQELVLRGF